MRTRTILAGIADKFGGIGMAVVVVAGLALGGCSTADTDCQLNRTCDPGRTGTGGTGSSVSSSTTSAGGGTEASSSSVGGAGGVSPMASVTVIVSDQFKNPASDIPVVVNDASGAVVATSKTGVEGKVPVTVPPGGSVSTFYSSDLSFSVRAVVDPPDGSTIPVTIYKPQAESKLPEMTKFLVTAHQLPQSTQELHLRDCGYDMKLPVSAPVDSTYVFALDNYYCKQYPAHSFLALAYDASNKPVAWGTALDQSTNPGSTVGVDIDVSQTSFTSLTATIATIPGWVKSASLGVSTALAAGCPVYYDLASNTSSPTKTYVQSFTLPQGIFKSYGVTEEVESDSGDVGTAVVRDRAYQTMPATTNFNVTGIALVSVNPLDVADRAHPRITWSTSAGSRGDFGSVYLTWGGGTASTAYIAVFPADHATSFQIPDVPSELSSYAPTATSAFGTRWAWYMDQEAINGYAQSSNFNPDQNVDGLGTVSSQAWNAKSAP